MKTQIFPQASLFLMLAMLLSCEREYDNPWDAKATLDPNAWAPQNLTITDVSITEKKLSWTYGDKNIEGFKLDRKVGNGEWQIAYMTCGKEIRFWSDTQVIPDPSITYYYRLYTFAGQYSSAMISSSSSSSQVPTPTNLQITQNSIVSVTLTWQYNSNGHEGFKIERKAEGGNWEPLTALAANILTFQDNTFTLNTTIFYRLSAFVGQYNSTFAEKSFNSEIPSPTNLQLTVNSITSITLTWQYNSNGADGFKIDRKVNQGTWENEFATLNANQTSFTENGLDLLNNFYTYRVYAFIQNYFSQKAVSPVTTVPCGYPFTDSRDGNQYETVEIGGQCWMKENLAYLPSVSPSTSGSQTSLYYYVYGYQGTSITAAKATANYQTYGALYNWPAALTACPQGWHLPTDAEWTTLTTFLGGESVAGGKMKEAGTTHWNSPNTGATNESGFTGLPGGYRASSGVFSGIGDSGDWWSSTETSSAYAWRRNLFYDYANSSRYGIGKEYGFSVRCLRD
jgi:uncharacterized protein (TIGR02145 family)